MAVAGKDMYEALADLFKRVDDTVAEASFDRIVNELIYVTEIAARHDGTGRAEEIHVAARSFQKRYRKIEL